LLFFSLPRTVNRMINKQV